jgi:DNA-binding transcriptional LysR family regulator
MKQTPSLDDLALFVQVAEAGGLAGAARLNGVSVPTLSRKMQRLERQLGRVLFSSEARGYSLTAEGRSVLEQVAELGSLRTRLGRSLSISGPTDVRITAGSWTSTFLAHRLGGVWTDRSIWRPVFIEAAAKLDIARRGADIGIRNRRPDQHWLAARRTGTVEYAVFAISAEVRGFVALSQAEVQTPSAIWVREHHADKIVSMAGSPRLLADLALAGLGRVVLPCLAGRDIVGLQQVGPVIDALTHEEWLVSHHEARHDSPVRAALDALAQLLGDRHGIVSG